MPRKKATPLSMFDPIGTQATRISQAQRVLVDRTEESGDPYRDGQIWLSRLRKTRKYRQEMPNGATDWKLYFEWFEGHHWNQRGHVTGRQNADNARETATVNKVGSIINSLVPFIVNGDIEFLLKPRKVTETISAELQQSLLNYEWRERKMTRVVKQCVKDAAIIGHCVAKTGYTIEVDSSTDPEESGEIVYDDFIRQDSPFIERVDPMNFFFDLSAHDKSLHTARWCAEVFMVPIYDVLANSSYDSQALEMITGGQYDTITTSAFDGIGMSDPTWKDTYSAPLPEERLVVLIEIWDKKYKNRIIMADGCPRPLLAEKWPYDYLDNFPYVMTNYIDVPNKPYGMGVMRNVEDQQNQLNRIRTAQFNHIRSHQRKFIARNTMNDGELKKFTDGGDGTVIVSESPDDIRPIADAEMSQDYQIVEARIVADMNEATGADALLQGQALGSRTTAGEIGTRARIQGLKTDAIIDNIEAFVEELAVQVLHHLKKNRTVPDVIEVAGAQGVFWREFTSEEIQADTDLQVQQFSALKEDPGVVKNQALQILQLAVQALPALAQAGAPQAIDVVQMFGWVLDKFGEKDIGRFFKPALAPRSPLVEGQEIPEPGLPPELAPQQLPTQPPNPAEGLSPEDLLMQLQGASLTGGLPQG